LKAEGFFCSLGILCGGLGISKLQFLIKKIKNLNYRTSCKFFSILGHQTRIPDPDPESRSAIRKNAGFGSVSRSALNQCGSATLFYFIYWFKQLSHECHILKENIKANKQKTVALTEVKEQLAAQLQTREQEIQQLQDKNRQV
jgi:hypothetical protein